MTVPWIVAFLVLAAVVLLLAVSVLGLLRRVTGVLEQAEARLSASPAGLGGAPRGTAIPQFEVRDASGVAVSSADLFVTPSVALFMSAGCQPCRALAAEMTEVGETVEGVPLHVVLEDSAAAREFPLPRGVRAFYQVDQVASRVRQESRRRVTWTCIKTKQGQVAQASCASSARRRRSDSESRWSRPALAAPGRLPARTAAVTLDVRRASGVIPGRDTYAMTATAPAVVRAQASGASGVATSSGAGVASSSEAC